MTDPPFDRWADLARQSARTAEGWEFSVGGRAALSVREDARRLLTEGARAWSDELGIRTSPADTGPGLVVATGHQPELYHTGVWAKVFLLQRIAGSLGATAVDVVVDSDAFDTIAATVPSFEQGVGRATHVLAQGGPDTCFACAGVPDREVIAGFCSDVARSLATLPDDSARRHFASYREALLGSAAFCDDLSRLMTAARRRYEGDSSDYLELPVTVASRTGPFARFVADIALSARRFAVAHNEELDAYRIGNGVRSAAQPFPDLRIGPDEVELPFWLLDGGVRSPVRARAAGSGVEIVGPRGTVVTLPDDPDEAVRALTGCGVLVVPRAVTLTLFVRTFLSDLFIHGTGGARYDRVTEGVARRWWGVELPPAVTATLTMHLPLGVDPVSEEAVSALDQRLHRLAHNPDEAVGEATFASASERDNAVRLAEEKRTLVEEISAAGADRKALGLRIRAVNAELASLLEPVAQELRREREVLSAQHEAAGVMTDRTYPFCLFSPDRIADVVR